MNDKELLELAVQADLCDEYGTVNYEYGYLEEIIAYGKLVAAKEREACAKVCEDIEAQSQGGDDPPPYRYYEAIRARNNT